jgi:hypothetical protein
VVGVVFTLAELDVSPLQCYQLAPAEAGAERFSARQNAVRTGLLARYNARNFALEEMT